MVRFGAGGEELHVPATLYKMPSGSNQPYRRKCLVLAVLEIDHKGHTIARGRVVIDLADLACIKFQETRAFMGERRLLPQQIF